LRGQAGGDRLYGGDGHDRLEGGRARDLFYARDGIRDRIEGGAGRDCARIDPGLDVTSGIHENF
jgi:serralysin